MTSRANCCVPGCNSVYKNNPELTFHHFPNDSKRIVYVNDFGTQSTADRKKIWEIKLKIGKRITKNMRVCSKHFVDEDFITPSDWGYKKRYLKKTAIPSKNLPVSSIITKSTIYQQRKNKRLERLLKRRQVNSSSCVFDIEQTKDTFNDNDAAEVLLELGDVHLQEFSANENGGKEFPVSSKVFVDVGTQTNDPELQNAEVQVNTNWTSISEFIQTENALSILTGIPSFSLLFFLVKFVSAYKKDFRNRTLSVKDRILLVFLKLKLDLTYSALGILFGGISVPTCKRNFQDTVEVLSDILSKFVYVPSKEDVLKNMPVCFQKYQQVRLILDCTEIKVQVPKKLCCKIKLYSHYKKNHTIKFMTAVTPSGFIGYVSPAYGGRASDKSIFEQSGIIDQLIPYVDKIMVDKGFLIDKLCEENGIQLVRPAFLRKKKQFNKSEATTNRTIASARVHVERVNARIKVFRIFRNTFPRHLISHVNDIFITICGIVNLSRPIFRDQLFLH